MGFRIPDPSAAWTPDEARAIFDEWHRSGESIAAFARRYGVSASRLYWWRRRLEDASVVGPSFVPASIAHVQRPPAPVERVLVSTDAMVTVRLADITIEVAHATPSWVAAMVSELTRSLS